MAIRYKVRPTRQAGTALCAPELATMLACFAATGDLRGASEGVQGCASAVRALQACMSKRHPDPKSKKGSINYLLTQIKK